MEGATPMLKLPVNLDRLIGPLSTAALISVRHGKTSNARCCASLSAAMAEDVLHACLPIPSLKPST